MVRDVAEYMAVLKVCPLKLAQVTTNNLASLFHINTPFNPSVDEFFKARN